MASTIKVNTIQDAGGNTLAVSDGSGNITTNNFKDIQWQSVVTADGSTATTAEAGKGYFIDNSSATHTINLPASPSIGDTVAIVSLGNASAYNITIGRNSSNIQGAASDRTVRFNNQSEVLIYSNATEGWVVQATTETPPTYIAATGGTATTSGNFKIHTFNSSSNFVVTDIGNQSHTAEYVVVAGGGAGGSGISGGGGAGGFRTNYPSPDTGGFTLAAQTYPITVGAGSAQQGQNATPGSLARGSNSVFSTITSTGGGAGGNGQTGGGTNSAGQPGGSGGGSGYNGSAPHKGSGNTPPVSPAQGYDGGYTASGPGVGTGGGGGSSAVGANGSPSGGGVGGAGTSNSITGSAVVYAGGGGAGGYDCAPVSGGPAHPGGGGGGAGGTGYENQPGRTNAAAGTANTGGGGGGGGEGNNPGGSNSGLGGSGGSGVVIIRYKYQG